MEKKKPSENYIFTDNATFRGNILEPEKQEMSERRKERLKAAENRKNTNAKVRKRRAFGAVTKLLIFVAFCVVLGLLAKSFYSIYSLEKEKESKEAELERLENEIVKDKDILQQVNSDEYVEQQARSELKMIKEGELLFIVRDDGTKVPVDENGNPLETEPED